MLFLTISLDIQLKTGIKEVNNLVILHIAIQDAIIAFFSGILNNFIYNWYLRPNNSEFCSGL